MAEKIAIGSDHGGFGLKGKLKAYLEKKGYRLTDFGTGSEEPCDYPLIGYRLSKEVSKGRFRKGILICKSGIGMAIIANKLPGVRSGVCNTTRQARTSRLHNDTNVLSLAAEYVSASNAKKIAHTWLTTKTLGGRHARRVREIRRLEKK